MSNKKSQAAMEFLLTYGWAIMVVVVAIAALAYFGVLNPTKWFSTNTCTLPAGLSCIDHSITYIPLYHGQKAHNDFTIVIKNNLGADSHITSLALSDQYGQQYSPAVPDSFPNGQSDTITVSDITISRVPPNNPSMLSGTKYDKDFVVTITNDASGLPHLFQGHISGKVN